MSFGYAYVIFTHVAVLVSGRLGYLEAERSERHP
jgi:hypothetical protein